MEIDPPAYLVRKFMKETMALLLLNLKTPEDAPAFAYVAMPSDKVAEFFKTFAGKGIDWPDYATVLFQGAGATPPDAVKEWFYDTYGFDS
jgi:hypothetical protein